MLTKEKLIPVSDLATIITLHYHGARFERTELALDGSGNVVFFVVPSDDVIKVLQCAERDELLVSPIPFMASEKIIRRWIRKIRGPVSNF